MKDCQMHQTGRSQRLAVTFLRTFNEYYTGPHYAQYRWNIYKEAAGSVLLSAGCHAVDALRHFVKDEAMEVTAYSNRRNPDYEYDTNLVGILKFAGGAIGKVSASFDAQPPYAFNIDLLGEKGSIRDNHPIGIWFDRSD